MPALDPARWALISPHFDELLALSPPERERRLAAWRAHDPALAQDLHALLDAHEAVARDNFLGTPIATGWLAGASGPAAGEALGAWTLMDVVGEGGMGRVWRARRNDGRFDGEAAIKLLRADLTDPTARGRFQREGAILGRLRHPGIAQLLDAGVTPKGQPYLVLEYVHGERIDRWCEAQALDVRQRVELFLQVLEAVAAAHAQLVIHRDLKPSNILVDGEGRVKLLDFGIAKLVADGDTVDETQVTRIGGGALTPRYAAPEQLAGEALTTATDVYALGIVLCELLTGRHPSGLDRQASSLDYLRAATERDAVRASALLPGQQRVLRGDLDNILAKALQGKPAARYISATALAEDLQRYLRHEPVHARKSTWRYRLARALRRRPVETALAVALVLSLTLGAAAALLQARRAEQARDQALRELAASEAANEFVSTLLSESGGASFTTATLLQRADTVLAAGFEADPAIRARLLKLVGSLWGQLDEYTRALATTTSARDAAAQAQDGVLMADIECTLAHIDAVRGEPAKARQRFDAALATLRRGGRDATTALVACLQERADVALRIDGDPAGSLRMAQEADALLKRDHPADQRQRIKLLGSMGHAESALGHPAAAVSNFEQALALLRTRGRQRSAFAAAAWNVLGVAYARAGLPLKALDAYAEAAAIERGLSAQGPPNSAVEANRAKLLDELGRPQEALPVLLAAVERSRASGNRHGTFHTATFAATASCSAGEVAACDALLQEARGHLQAVFPAGHVNHAVWDVAQARLHLARGDRARALQGLEAADAIFRKAKSRTPTELRALALRSQLELSQGLVAQARASVQRLDTLARGFADGFPQSAWLGISLLAQARVKKAEGDAPAATVLLEQAVAQLHATLGDLAPETVEARALAARSDPPAPAPAASPKSGVP